MDIQEWEILPDKGFLEIHDDGGKEIFSRKYGLDQPVLKMNHFIYRSQDSTDSRVPNPLVPVPIQLEPVINKATDIDLRVKEISHVPSDINILPSAKLEKNRGDQDPVSHVSFKKKETVEFVDMKMDSPKSKSSAIFPQIDAGMFLFAEKDECFDSQGLERKNCSSKVKVEKEVATKRNRHESDGKDLGERNGFNIWKWNFTGIGAICSFGIAAATVCIFIIGNGHQRNKNQQQNQMLRFEIYSDDKGIKQVVHHATKLNEAISAVKGFPLAKDHITVGGYYDIA